MLDVEVVANRLQYCEDLTGPKFELQTTIHHKRQHARLLLGNRENVKKYEGRTNFDFKT